MCLFYVLSSLNICFVFFFLVPEHITITAVSKNCVNVTWEGQPEIDRYEVSASTSQGTKSKCSVGESDAQASCEGLSPCTDYNITARACHAKRGCGEPAVLSVTTYPGRKFNDSIFLLLAWAARTSLYSSNSRLHFYRIIMQMTVRIHGIF